MYISDDAKSLGIEVRISIDPNGFRKIYFKNTEEMNFYKLAGIYKEQEGYYSFKAGFLPRLKDGSIIND